MNHPLDFIVFGIPRSGTKALVRALNLHPNVYCAMERFHFRADHSRLTFPESFVDTKGLGNRDDPAKIRRIQQELAQKDDVRTVGNKLPRYYFALDRINREIPNARNIWIYRSPFGFVPSWNVREQTRGKGQWPTGQIGLFGMLELLVCIENSLALFKDVLVFPYRHGLGNSTESLLRTIDFLDADPSVYDRARFADMQTRREEKRRRGLGDATRPRHLLQDYEEEFLATLRVRTLDDIMEQGRVLTLSELAKPLREYLASIDEVLPRAIDRAFSACTNRAAPAFGRSHFNRNREEFAVLHARARSSKALSGFRKFDARQRLNALYQRLGPRLLSSFRS